MVKKPCVKRCFGLAITFFVIANLALGSHIFAKQLEIKAADVERIKTALSMAQTVATVSDIIINNKDLATVLNTIIGGSKTGIDITYGLVVLGALNEMDLVDLAVSGRYRDEAREYFNSVLEQTTDLTSYWKSTSQNIFSLIRREDVVTPTTGLVAESVAILEKTMSIIVSTKVWLTVETYNGMWRYFQDRMNGDTHEDAWYLAEGEMGYVPEKEKDIKTSDGWRSANNRERQILQLEPQFVELYDNWEPYVTPFGISEKYKKRVKEELSGTLIAAVKENVALAKNEPKTSLIDKLAQQLEKLKEVTAALIAQVNPFKAGVALNLPEEPEIVEPVVPPQELIEVGPQSIEPLSITESLPIITEIKLREVGPPSINGPPSIEPSPVATTTIPELLASTTEPVPLPEPPPPPMITPTPIPIPTPGPVFCERDSGNPTRFRVLINEIAWMGTNNSANDEWIELKNIWGIPVKLSGWQLLDKDQQIKIIFGEKDIIPASGYFLLERTDDNSIPDAKADLIYTGALGNTDEALYLFDDQCKIEDEILANPNWPAGDNSLKKPMARFDVLGWYASVSTPGGENSSPPIIRSSAGVSAPLPTPSSASPQIFITEVRISPLTERFVELYNPNNETVDLTGWYIQRKVGEGPLSSFVSSPNFEGKTIGPLDYFLVAHSSSTVATSADILLNLTLTLNNTLLLKNPDREIVSQVSTDNPAAGKSYGRKWSSTTLNYTEDFEAQTPTPRAQNQNSVVEDDGSEEESLLVVINETAWMGTGANSADEWIELYNNTSSTIDLTGWTLGAADGVPLITFATSTILAQNYFLLERTDDNTISDIPADLIYTGALGNTGEKLELKDAGGNVVDLVDASTGWFAGEASPNYVSMERINPSSGSNHDNWTSNNLITKNGLDANGSSINGTPKAENSVAKNYTVLSGGIIFSEDFTLRRLGSPYISDGPIHVLSGATLSIEPGVIIKLKHGSSRIPYAELKIEGSLEALGGNEQNQKIVFTSYRDDEYGGDTNNDGNATQPAVGDWDWVYFKDSVSNLQNVIVRYGGKLHSDCCGGFPSYTYGAIYIDGGQLTISSSTIEKSATLGIWIHNSSTTQINVTEFKNIDTSWSKPAAIYIENGSSTINNSTFIDNNIGILVENFANPTIENNAFENNRTPIKTNNLLANFYGNTAQNNTLNGILVSGLGFSDTVSEINWRKTNLPYILESSASVSFGKILNIEAGVVIKLKGGGRFYIDGTLAAQGTQTEKIIFTSLSQETAGSWDFIKFSALSTNSILDNVIVRYGGWYNASFKSGAIKIENTGVAISNSLFENNLVAGLELENCTTTITNTVFKNHRAKYNYDTEDSMGIWVKNESNECPNLTGVSFGEGENANTTDVYPSECHP